MNPVTNAAGHFAFQLARIEAGFERAVETQVRRIRQEMDQFITENEWLLHRNPPVFAWRCSEALRERLMALWPDLHAAYTELAVASSRASGNVIAANRRVSKESIQEDTQDDLSDSIFDVSDEVMAWIIFLSRDDIQILLTYMIWQGQTLESAYRQLANIQAALLNRSIMQDLVGSIVSPIDMVVGDLSNGRPLISTRSVREVVSTALAGSSPVSRTKGRVLRELSSLVTTQVHAIAGASQDMIIRKNPGKIVGEVWSAMMEDSRTCAYCRSLNGNYYPLKYGKSTAPEQPAHRLCRCHLTPVSEKPASKESAGEPVTFSFWMKHQTERFQKTELGRQYEGWKAGHVTFRDMKEFRTICPIRIRLLDSLHALAG